MPFITLSAARTWFIATFIVVVAISSSAESAEFTAMTFNTKHGGEAPWNTAAQIAEIVAESPDIVLLQEANSSQLEEYVNGINKGLNTTAWRGEYAYHCDAGHAPVCTSRTDEAVMILTRFPITDTEKRLIWAPDQYFVARGVLRATVRLDDGSSVQVFAAHLPPSDAGQSLRSSWVSEFLPWARAFTGPRLVGGDFNDDPSSAPIVAMKHEYVDAFGTKGSGPGGTHSHDDKTYVSRIDYLFCAGGLQVKSAYVSQVALSDHRPVVASYTTTSTGAQPTPTPRAANLNPPAGTNPGATVPPTPTAPATAVQPPMLGPTAPASATASATTGGGGSSSGETVLLDDDFEAGIDPAKWPTTVFSGYQDLRVSVQPSGAGIGITPMTRFDGISRYNGISSAPVDVSGGGYGRVQLVQGPIGAAAFAMFTAESDALNFYRIYQGGAADARVLILEKRIDGTRIQLGTLPYTVTDDQYLTIRHDYRPQDGVDDVVFEASQSPIATASVELFRERWDPKVTSSALVFELKAGTSAPEQQPGTVIFDNFHAAAISGR